MDALYGAIIFSFSFNFILPNNGLFLSGQTVAKVISKYFPSCSPICSTNHSLSLKERRKYKNFLRKSSFQNDLLVIDQSIAEDAEHLVHP